MPSSKVKEIIEKFHSDLREALLQEISDGLGLGSVLSTASDSNKKSKKSSLSAEEKKAMHQKNLATARKIKAKKAKDAAENKAKREAKKVVRLVTKPLPPDSAY